MEQAARIQEIKAREDYTLGDFLESIDRRNAFYESPDFDPAAFIGDLDPKQDTDGLKGKIHRTILFIESVEYDAGFFEAKAEHYAKLAKAARNKGKSSRNYVDFNMQSREYEKLPGIDRNIVRRRASVPSVIWLRDATPADLKIFPDFVRVIPRQYEFINDPVKKFLKTGESACDFARLEYSHKLIFEDIRPSSRQVESGVKKA